MDSLPALCLLLFLDGASFSFFTTPLLLHYGHLHPAWQVALLGGVASAAGSVVQLLILRWALSSRHHWMRGLAPSQEKLAAVLERYRAVSFLMLVVARATPLPDAPLKIVAAAGGYPSLRYGFAVLLGALPYYYALALVGGAFKIPTSLLVGAGAVIVLGALFDWWRKRRRGE
jgi:membrane protein YqaA with SNARE-associated domain